MEDNLIEYCIGCATYLDEEGNHSDCAHSKDNGDGECPCTSCVVKPMCGNPCRDFDVFTGELVEGKDFVYVNDERIDMHDG